MSVSLGFGVSKLLLGVGVLGRHGVLLALLASLVEFMKKSYLISLEVEVLGVQGGLGVHLLVSHLAWLSIFVTYVVYAGKRKRYPFPSRC